MSFDRSCLRELEVRVAHPQHWSAGEHQLHVEKLRQLRFRLSDQNRQQHRSDQPAS